MAVIWIREPGGRLVVENRGPAAARLFGLPFLAVGAYFVYQLAVGAVRGELTIAGWVGLPVMAAAFLFPGIVLTLGSKRTVLDPGTREVLEVRDFGVYKQAIGSAIPDRGEVVLRDELRRNGKDEKENEDGTTHLFLPVELPVAGGRQVLLALFDGTEGNQALAFAKEAASVIGGTVRDERHGPGETIEEVGSEDAG